MKIIIITAIILGVFTAYFVFNIEKSVSVKGRGNAIPAGTDMAKFILNKAKKIEPGKIISNFINGNEININKSGEMFKSDITEEIKSKAGGIKDKLLNEGVDLVKQPIKGKMAELFCPQN